MPIFLHTYSFVRHKWSVGGSAMPPPLFTLQFSAEAHHTCISRSIFVPSSCNVIMLARDRGRHSGRWRSLTCSIRQSSTEVVQSC